MDHTKIIVGVLEIIAVMLFAYGIIIMVVANHFSDRHIDKEITLDYEHVHGNGAIPPLISAEDRLAKKAKMKANAFQLVAIAFIILVAGSFCLFMK
jgi:hypothetical protein